MVLGINDEKKRLTKTCLLLNYNLAHSYINYLPPSVKTEPIALFEIVTIGTMKFRTALFQKLRIPSSINLWNSLELMLLL